MKQTEDERLPNKSIKELKAANKELADFEKRMLIEAKAEWRIRNVWNVKQKENERNELLKQEMASNQLVGKGKVKLFEKT